MNARLVLVAALAIVFAGEAQADFISGNELWDACQADETKEPARATLCIGYILGAGETYQALHVANQVTYYCVPDKVHNGQVIDVVKLYLRDHPETIAPRNPKPTARDFFLRSGVG